MHIITQLKDKFSSLSTFVIFFTAFLTKQPYKNFQLFNYLLEQWLTLWYFNNLLQVRTHFARPNWQEVFRKIASKHPHATVGKYISGQKKKLLNQRDFLCCLSKGLVKRIWEWDMIWVLDSSANETAHNWLPFNSTYYGNLKYSIKRLYATN